VSSTPTPTHLALPIRLIARDHGVGHPSCLCVRAKGAPGVERLDANAVSSPPAAWACAHTAGSVSRGRRRLGMARSLIATPPPAATPHDARLPALTPHHAASHTAVMGALPSSLARRVDSLSSPNRLTATTGTTWRGTHTIRSRGVPQVPIPRRRARCLGHGLPGEHFPCCARGRPACHRTSEDTGGHA